MLAVSATRRTEFVVAGFFKNDMGRWIEVSDRQCEEDGVEFLYMVRSADGSTAKPPIEIIDPPKDGRHDQGRPCQPTDTAKE